MNAGRFIRVGLVLLILGGAIVWLMDKPHAPPGGISEPAAAGQATTGVDSTPPPAAADDRSHLADGLDAPGGTTQDDVRIIADVLTAWQTNFPHDGNPVGENFEITRALTGKNKLKLALIPPDHPAINRKGELVDRWGTPFRFHQWSGTVMEIISAGPDRKFSTKDDVSSQ